MEEEYTNEDGLLWDYFEGSETSKIFGIFTHCQYQEENILEVVNSDKIIESIVDKIESFVCLFESIKIP